MQRASVATDVGEDEGKYYAMNVPLKKGIDDESYNRVFKTVSFILIRLQLTLSSITGQVLLYYNVVRIAYLSISLVTSVLL